MKVLGIGIWLIGLLLMLASPGGAGLRAAEAMPGAAAPDFTLSDTEGQPVKLGSFAGKIVVLEWINPDCPFVQRVYQSGIMKDLATEYGRKGVVWLAVNSTHYMDAAASRQWKEKYALPYPILDDRAGAVGRMYGAQTTPHMFVIDKSGKLVYAGGLDDDPRGDRDKPGDYVRQALDALLAGKVVALAETKPYGCSVKYAAK